MGFSVWFAILIAALVCIGKLQATYQDANISTITRDNVGDIFMAEGVECNADTCVGVSSGTASHFETTNENFPKKFCECQCHKHLPVFREDLRICVDDIRECSLASFVSSSTVQQIPFVYLPLEGQIIYPSKEIKLPDLKAPICALSNAKILSKNGWSEIRNPIDGDIPLRLFRDEGRVFLQWTGNSEQRLQMQGKLILVYIICREVSVSVTSTDESSEIFTPCVSFRVAGTTKHTNHSISEVLFQQPSEISTSRFGFSEYVAIGICSILLALVYVASVLLYLYLRRKNNQSETKSSATDSQNFNALEEGIIKNNPLLTYDKHFPTSNSSLSDSSSIVSENDDTHSSQFEEKHNKRVQTSALVHLQNHEFIHTSNQDPLYQEPSSIEKLPEENVSIVETIEHRDDQSDSLKSITGNTRKKLYFNPAYFEPQLLMAPPPAAVEFLTKIREVMAIAKQKMASKKFVPNLIKIPEEDSFEPVYEQSRSIHSSRKDSVVSLKRENSRKRQCPGCSGCKALNVNFSVGKIPDLALLPACQNCSISNESKERSIQRWLEEIPARTGNDDWTYKIRDENSYIPTKRLRSPTRSLPPENGPQLCRSLSPKPASESGRITKVSLPYNAKLTKPTHLKPKKSKAPRPPQPNTSTLSDKNALLLSNQITSNNNEVLMPILSVKKNQINFKEKVIASVRNKNLKALNGDYDTDSLERSQPQKGSNFHSDVDNVSSQPSPSLSSALPLEEELTITNAVICPNVDYENSKSPLTIESSTDSDYHLTVLKSVCKKVMDSSFYNLPELLQNNGNKGYSLVSEVYVNDGYTFEGTPNSPNDSPTSTLEKRRNSVKYIQPEPGQLLIEVEDCPDNYIKVDEQDFEPDTLDRKPSKRCNNDTSTDQDNNNKTSKIQLKTTGSFKTGAPCFDEEKETKPFLSRNFGSLREIYQERSMLKASTLSSPQKSLPDCNKNCKQEGALLTLEERHAKRQRRLTFTGCSNIPPDVIPPSTHVSLYDYPKPPNNDVVDSQLKNGISENNSPVSKDINDKEIYANCKEGLFRNDFMNNDDDSQTILNVTDLYDKIKVPVEVEQKVFNVNNINTTRNINDIFRMKSIVTKPEDSGYLSTDSNYNIKKTDSFIVSVPNEDGESETDDSLADGQSESGAESVETHSVFFGSYYGSSSCIRDSVDSGVGFDNRSAERLFCSGDDADGSDSEAMSYATVVPVESIS